MGPQDILRMLDEVRLGEKKTERDKAIGLLEPPSFTTVLPELLTCSDRTKVHSLIRRVNMFPDSADAKPASWLLLAIHLAVSQTTVWEHT